MLYGCIFQAVFNNDFNEFSLCRNCLHGCDDNAHVTKVYNDYKHSFKEKAAEEIIKNHLNHILKLNISELLKNLDINYFTNNQSKPYHFRYDAQYLKENSTINVIKLTLEKHFKDSYRMLKNLQI